MRIFLYTLAALAVGYLAGQFVHETATVKAKQEFCAKVKQNFETYDYCKGYFKGVKNNGKN